MDDVEFSLVANADVRGASLRVLGHHMHHYDNIGDCFAVCAAASDCAAFVDLKPIGTCSFKRHGGKVLLNQAESDVYVRKQPPPSAIPRVLSPSSPPLQPLQPLTSDDSEHRIGTVAHFMSADEADTLRHFAERCFEASGRSYGLPISLGDAGCEAGDAAVLLSRIEERIAAVTGIAAHEAEESLMFTRVGPARDPAEWFENLHHDKNKQERREVTVVVYLTSQSDAQGGHTIFPTLTPRTLPIVDSADAPSPPSPPPVAQYAAAVAAAYATGKRSLGCRDRQPPDHQPPDRQPPDHQPPDHPQRAAAGGTSGCGDAGGTVDHTRRECERALHGGAHSVALRPRRGAALVFWSVLRNGTADAAMWHTGCVSRERSKLGRWVMQKFKSRPLELQGAGDAPTGGGEAPGGEGGGEAPGGGGGGAGTCTAAAGSRGGD